MAKHVWTILSNKTMIDRTSNAISLIDVIEQINLSGSGLNEYKKGREVVIPFNYSLATLWIRSDPKKPEKVNSRTTLFTPDNKISYSQEIEIDLTNHQRRRSIIDFRSLPLSGPGTYKYKIEQKAGKNWKTVATFPFDVFFDLSPDEPKEKELNLKQ